MAEENPAAQRQKTVTAYFSSKQLLLFVFARQRCECQNKYKTMIVITTRKTVAKGLS